MTSPKDAAARGRSNRRRGTDAEKRSKELVRRSFPGAERTRAGESGPDFGLSGVGDRVLEVTVAEWTKIGSKACQAAGNARRADLREWFVLKPRRREPGQPKPEPGESMWWAITDAALLLSLLAELDALRSREWREQAGWDDAYTQGWNARARELEHEEATL